ncbi:MAG: hypothetical protein U0235_29565 [Polyangiaceae bacterium]
MSSVERSAARPLALGRWRALSKAPIRQGAARRRLAVSLGPVDLFVEVVPLGERSSQPASASDLRIADARAVRL